LAEKRGGLPHEASYYSLKLTIIQVRKPVIPTKNSNMSMPCDHLRMLCGHIMRRRTIAMESDDKLRYAARLAAATKPLAIFTV